MIDKNDKLTQDFISKNRGRPATGNAMTPAERKRRQRSRAATELRKAMNGEQSMADLSMTALMHELHYAVKLGQVEIVKKLNAEILKRAKGNAK